MTTRRSSRDAPRAATTTVVVRVVALSQTRGHLAVLLQNRAGAEGRLDWRLPAARLGDDSLDEAARDLTIACTGALSCSIDQIGASDAHEVESGRIIAVEYLALLPPPLPDDATHMQTFDWFSIVEPLPIDASQRQLVTRAVLLLQSRMEHEPVAFSLLRPTFTLTELQTVYELLLGQPLHKASFRRALFAARLVAETNEWRQERRGRPARLYRYAPQAPREVSRGVRFDRLGS